MVAMVADEGGVCGTESFTEGIAIGGIIIAVGAVFALMAMAGLTIW
ncbi:hypothetical protein NZD89_09015 [Alicyclobacillus fastidiosus]|uniref:Uncharacterized protein n=1 Tax=Alicyclobacillus fastidiosus TaxID=392011 RepID=A0ABY6ZKV4_9BACL|nr:hypothetical protein [Alicyclobacillus fastidiosus]WAH43501.1 hypothetical protein NZD89_09015 [Alicyclobacillus fastidiosus]GMA59662.1 hypothetical protein GCM10025859_01020 [Alicyclobacillus fastidiosus]